MEESLINYTQFTSTTSSYNSDDSFDVGLQDDRGVLHLMGHEVFANDDLLKHIEECTPYEMTSHVISDSLDYKELARREKISDKPHYYVFADFENSGAFEKLRNLGLRILGVPVVFQCVLRDSALSAIIRKKHCSIFTLAMSDLFICFTNFADRIELNEMRLKVKMMNGVVKPEYNSENENIVLVARAAGRPKFESHQILGRFAVKRKWVDDCYALRHDINLKPCLLYLENPATYFCPIFYELRIALHGFSDDKGADNGLIQHSQQLGAKIVDYTDKSCTHLVMNSSLPSDALKTILPNGPGPNMEVVNDVWLWECIAMDQYVPPKQYRFPAQQETSKKESRESSGNKKRKVELGSFSCTPNKRRVSSELEGSVICNTSLSNLAELAAPAPTKRDMIIAEFVKTEESYVRHLEIIEKNYFCQIYRVICDEEHPVQNHVTILDNYRMFSKIIPIRLAHQALLRELSKMLEQNVKCDKSTPQKRSRKADGSFGKILLNWTGKDCTDNGDAESSLTVDQLQQIFEYDRNVYRDYNKSKQDREARDQEDTSKRKKSGEAERGEPIDVEKVYKVYLTSKEDIANMVDRCEATNYRFKALLKAEGAKKENQRLSLRDLMIEPIQRLPRMILLIDAILNKTDAAHPDHKLLGKVQARFRVITKELNDTKEKVDSSYELMGLLRDISGLPMDKMSAKLQKKEQHSAISLSDIGAAVTQGSSVCLFLFELGKEKENENKENKEKAESEKAKAKEPNDGFTEYHDSALEIVRARIKIGSVNSAAALDRNTKKSQYKHVLHIPLRAVTHVFTDLDTDDKFGLTYLDPAPSNPASCENRKCKKMEEKKPKEITILFRLLCDESVTPLELQSKRCVWQRSLVDSVNYSRQHYNLPNTEEDRVISFLSLEGQLGSKDTGPKPKRDIFNFAKRSVSRAFSQKQGKYAMRKTQSQFGLSSDAPEFVGKLASPGRSVKYPKRVMRDSH